MMPTGHYPRPPLAERLWSRVTKGSDCWEWTARVNDNGYGYVSFDYQKHYAHRVSWELTYGQIPHGLCVLHRCDNRRCVRPEHLFLGTRADNQEDMRVKGRARRTRCKRGHLLEGNRYAKPSNRTKTECATCRRARLRPRSAAAA